MNRIARMFPVVFIALLAMQAYALASVRVFTRDEGLSESNITKPRIYIENTGTTAISGFTYYYYITAEGGQTPVLETYSAPNTAVTLEQIDAATFRVKYDAPSIILQPGQITPDASGNVVGLHYNNWSAWDKTNDYSNTLSSTFSENTKVTVYSAGVIIYGTEPGTSGGGGGGTPPVVSTITPVLNTFALYSSQESLVKDRSVFNGGGAVGSNGYVEVGSSTIINGNVVCGGNILVRSGGTVNGDATAAGTVTLQSGASVSGAKVQGATIATVAIPNKGSVTVGSQNMSVQSGQSQNLTPGFYGNLEAQSNATVTLVPGNYTFNTITLRTGAKIVYNCTYNQIIEIDVQGDIQIEDRASMAFSDPTQSYAPAVKIYTYSENTMRIGCDASVAGIVTAPHGTIAMFSRARCAGALYAKKISIEPDAVVISTYVNPDADDDHDGVPNLYELAMGTNPADPNSWIASAIPATTTLNPSAGGTIEYDFTTFFSGIAGESGTESQRAGMGKITVSSGSTGSGVAPTWVPANDPLLAGVPQFTNSDYLPVGLYVNIKTDIVGTVKVSIPIPGGFAGIPSMVKVARYNQATQQWVVENPESTDQWGPIVTIGSSPATYILVYPASSLPSTVLYNTQADAVFNSRPALALLRVDFRLKEINCDPTLPSTITRVTIGYNDKNAIARTLVIPFDDMEIFENDLYINKEYTFEGPITLQEIRVQVCNNEDNAGINYVTSYLNKRVDNGMQLLINANNYLRYYVNRQGANITGSMITLSYCSVPDYLESSGYGDGKIIPEYAATGSNTPSSYTYHFYVKDHLGSTREVINSQGEAIQSTMYMPYGTMVNVGARTPDGTVRETFTGKELDDGTGLMYFGARYYDPEVGSMTATDPYEQYFNSYRYTGSDPINYIDPNGCADCLASAKNVEEGNKCKEAKQAVSDASSQNHTGTYATKTDAQIQGAIDLGYSTAQDYVNGAQNYMDAAERLARTTSEGANYMLDGDIAILNKFNNAPGAKEYYDLNPIHGNAIDFAAWLAANERADEYAMTIVPFSDYAYKNGGGTAPIAVYAMAQVAAPIILGGLAIDAAYFYVFGVTLGTAMGVDIFINAENMVKSYLTKDSKSNPFQGSPGTTSELPGKQTRTYAPDGYPDNDVDHDHDHGQGQPHKHQWGRPKNGGPPTHKDRGVGKPL